MIVEIKERTAVVLGSGSSIAKLLSPVFELYRQTTYGRRNPTSDSSANNEWHLDVLETESIRQFLLKIRREADYIDFYYFVKPVTLRKSIAEFRETEYKILIDTMATGFLNFITSLASTFERDSPKVRVVLFGTAALRSGGNNIDIYVCLKRFEREIAMKFAGQTGIKFFEINIPKVVNIGETTRGVLTTEVIDVVEKALTSDHEADSSGLSYRLIEIT